MNSVILSGSVKFYNMFHAVGEKLHDFKRKQDGVTAIEYAVIAVAISGLLLAVFGDTDSSFVGVLKAKFETLTSNIKDTVKS